MSDQQYCECVDALGAATRGYFIAGDIDDFIGDAEALRVEEEKVFSERAQTTMLEDQLNGVCGWCGFPIRPHARRASE